MTRAGGWWGARKPGLISGTGDLEAGWGLTILYHTDLPKSSLGSTPTPGEPLHPFRLLNVFACYLGCWFTTEWPLFHPLPALSLSEFSAILGHLKTQWFSQRTWESVDIYSAILPLPQIYTLQFLSPSGFFCQPFSSLHAEQSAPPRHISVCPLLPLPSPAGRVPIWVRK